jgi:hypothetical protein
MGFVTDFLIALLWWTFLFPVVWIVSAPWILIVSIFDKKSYIDAVASRFRSITKIWSDWGIMFGP